MRKDEIIVTLRRLVISGNPVAALYLNLLENCSPGEEEQLIKQIENFSRAITYQNRNYEPTEFKGVETITPAPNWR